MVVTAIDTETTLVSNAEPVPRLVSVAVASEQGCFLSAAHDPSVPEIVGCILEQGAAFANGPYDIFVLLRAYPELLPLVIRAYQRDRIFDVITREKMIAIAEGTYKKNRKSISSLGGVAMLRAGIELNKNDKWRKQYELLLGLEIAQWPADAKHYAMADAAATWAVWSLQEKFRRSHGLDVFKDEGNQARGHLALYAQTIEGILTDQEQVDKVDTRLANELEQLASQLMGIGLARIGGTKKAPKVVRSEKVAKAVLEQHCSDIGIKCPRTEKEDPSLSEKSLISARIPKDHPLDLYRRYGATQALRSKNITPLRFPLIRTKYENMADTGRTTSSAPQGKKKYEDLEPWEWVGTNLQNLPREGGFRECLVPPPGYKFIISDWSGAELVAFAQVQIDLFGHSKMAEALIAGRDLHSEVGAQILGVPYEQFDKDSNPEHKDTRQLAKIPNFGYPGGLGTRRMIDFAAGAPYYRTLAESETKRLKKIYYYTWPEAQSFHEWVARLEGPDGKIVLIQPRSGRIRGGCSFTEACNSCFQGLAADAAKLAMWNLWLAKHDPNSGLYGCPQVLFVHDENVTIAPEGRAEAALAEQERIMIEAFAHWCPDVPVRVESVISDRYVKP